jgi:ABC-type lipoprotein release transport system permease subunit
VAGLGFAFGGDRSGRGSGARYSILGVIVGIAGLVGALTFASSLDRLASTPSRYGWNADFSIIDVNDAMLDELASDPRIEAVTYVESKGFVADGVALQAYSHTDRVGTTGWTIIDGHAPEKAGEVVLTAQAARRLGRDVGDQIVSNDAQGNAVALVVAGLGIGPNNSSEKLDELALVHPEDMRTLGQSQAFSEALVRVDSRADRDDVLASYAEKYEVGTPAMPLDVANIVELGRLPEALGAFLAAIAVVALVHLLAVTSARRSRDLAVLRALGLTRSEVRRVVTVAAISVTTVGLVVGVPLGFALGRLVWWSVAHSIGVAPDASYVIAPVLVLVPVVLLASIAIAWLPALRATRSSVMTVLRAE